MRALLLVILLLLGCTTDGLARETIHCKEPDSRLPSGVLQALRATVLIQTVVTDVYDAESDRTRHFSSIGSGVIVSREGHIVMTGHRITPLIELGHSSQYTVVLSDCRAFSATLVAVGGDEKRGIDVNVIKLDNPPQDLVLIQKDENVSPQMFVYAIGSPYGWMNTVYKGIMALPDLCNHKKLCAHMNLQPGISGGVLVTSDGVMLGVAQGRGSVLLGDVWIPVALFIPVQAINQFLEGTLDSS